MKLQSSAGRASVESKTDPFRPSDLGLPYNSWRLGQLNAALSLVGSSRKFRLLSAPTGAGKSLIYLAAASLLSGRTLILTTTKGLQDQISRDFSTFSVFGRQNYACIESGESNADRGVCTVGWSCIHKDVDCYYYTALKDSQAQKIVVANYSLALSLAKHNPLALGEFNTLICDEAHDLPQLLSAFSTVRIENKTLSSLDINLLPTEVDNLAEWLSSALTSVDKQLNSTSHHFDRRRKLLQLRRDILDLSAVNNTWCIEITSGLKAANRALTCCPVNCGGLANEYLFSSRANVIFSSAYVPDGVLSELGVSEYDTISVASSFDCSRRPIIIYPVCRMDRNTPTGDLARLAKTIAKILLARIDRKGIIHTVSYARAVWLVEQLKKYGVPVDYIHTHKTGSYRQAVASFKRTKAPGVLVSPAITTGVDFPHAECRFIIIPKLPYPDTRGQLHRLRAKAFKGYTNRLTAISLLQSAGRGMRSHTDWCEVLILDKHWQHFRKRIKWPEWLSSALVNGTEANITQPIEVPMN